MNVSRNDVIEIAADTGFDSLMLEKARLIPTLHGSVAPTGLVASEYGDALVDECKAYLSTVLPLKKGRIDGSLLTDDPELERRIEGHPWLQWKAINVRKHKGLTE